MKKQELLDGIIENATYGEGLEINQECRYSKDNLSNKELSTLLEKNFKNYKVKHDYNNYNYIIIERIG